MSPSPTADSPVEAAPSPPPRRALLIAFLTVMLDLLGFGIIIPIQPFYAEHFGASPTMVTLLGASYSLMQFLFVPFWGYLSDRIGRRPVILTSVLLGTIGYVIFGLAGSLPMLFAARMLSGFGNANIATAQAIIADTTSGADRAKGMGLIGAAFGLGFIFGPALGGVLGQFGLAVPAYGAAVLGMLNLIFAAVMLPETLKKPAKGEAAAPSHGRRFAFGGVLKRLSGRHNVLPAVAIALVMTAGFAMLEQALGLFIERIWVPGALTATDPELKQGFLREAAALTSYILVGVGVTATIVQGGLIGRLSKRFAERNLVRTGLLLLTVGLALIPLAGWLESYALLFGLGILLAIGTGLATPSLNSLLSRSVHADEQGSALGLGQSASALGRVIGPALAGLLFEWSINAPFWTGSLTLAAALLIALLLRAPKPA